MMRNLISFLFIKYYYGEQIKKGEMGGTCSTYVKDEKCMHAQYESENQQLRELSVDGWIILKLSLQE
jgi:hypothetical protein